MPPHLAEHNRTYDRRGHTVFGGQLYAKGALLGLSLNCRYFKLGQLGTWIFNARNISGARICSLRLAISPAAVSWLVVSVVVDPIEREALRTSAHVRKKVFECHPPVANCNSASSVVFILTEIWRTAAMLDALPSRIFLGGFLAPMARFTVSPRD
jgi:hypothetical protein